MDSTANNRDVYQSDKRKHELRDSGTAHRHPSMGSPDLKILPLALIPEHEDATLSNARNNFLKHE